jgi:hypothetical protein
VTSIVLAVGAWLAGCTSFHENEGKGTDASDASGKHFVPPGDATAADAGRDARRVAPVDAGHEDTGAAKIDASDASDAVADSADASADVGCGEAGCGEVALSSAFVEAALVVLDGPNAYVADIGPDAGAVYECSKTGCPSPTLLGPGQATGIVVTGGHVYWSDSVGNEIVACAVGGCGGHPQVVVPNQLNANALGYDGTRFYWSAEGAILTAPTLGGTITTLATNVGNEVFQIASGGGTAFWVQALRLAACPWSGCSGLAKELTVAEGQNVVTFGSQLYFANDTDVDVCPQSPSSCTADVLGNTSAPFGLAVDSTYLYWLDDIITGVYRCPANGGGCQGGGDLFAMSNESSENATIALDNDYVYWTALSQLLRQHK